MFLLEPFTGSNDIESYITHFELLVQIQKWIRAETRDGKQVKIDAPPHSFALRLQKKSIDFYRILMVEKKTKYGETLGAFGTTFTDKPVVFRGRLARRVQLPGEKRLDCLKDLQCLATKAYTEDWSAIREHLVVRRFFQGTHNNQVRLELRERLTRRDNNFDRFGKGTKT